MSDDHEEEAVGEDYPNEGYIEKLEAALKTCRELREYDRAEIARLRRDLEIWRRNGGDILLRAEIERLRTPRLVVVLQPDDDCPGLWIGFKTADDRTEAMKLFALAGKEGE